MRKALTAALLAMVASLALSSSALAAQVNGTNGRDRLSGTGSADGIKAKAGNDRVSGRAGRDRIDAGRGNDRVTAGGGSDRVRGGAGADLLAGNAGADVITGGAGSDVITGGTGDDVIDARDGAVDTVTCGDGNDVAKLDVDDVIADATAENPNGSCETVLRGGTPGPGTGHDGQDCPGHGDGDRRRPPAGQPAPDENGSDSDTTPEQ
jgi:Ca2+-binding RTX toxin-like protein